MIKRVKILLMILSITFVFSLAGCAPQEEKPDEPGIIKPDLRVVSSYDQGGLYDGIEVALDFYQRYIKANVGIDAATAYAVSGAKYTFAYAVTEVSEEGEERTKSVVKPEEDLDKVWAGFTTLQNRNYVYRHAQAVINDRVSLTFDESGEKSDEEYFLPLEEEKGTIAFEFVLSVNERTFTHRIIADYNISDNNEIEYRQIKELSDFDANGRLNEKSSTEGNFTDDEMIDLYSRDLVMASRARIGAYYEQEMNAGKGSFTGCAAFLPSSRYDAMIMTVNGFAGYFDPSSPLTDIYIGFGVYGIVCRNYVSGRLHESGIAPKKFASLVLSVSSLDEDGNVLEEKSRTALDFVTSDKRYHAGTEYDRVLRQNELRGIIKVDDFIGERGKIKFGLAVAEPSFWLDEGENIGDIYVTMYYKKENGRIYIGKSLAEP